MASRPDYIPTSFAEALETLKGKQSRKIGNNTRLNLVEDGSINVVYHRTAIIKLNRNGSWAVADGGYDTVTTRARLDVFLYAHGFHLGRHKGVTRLTRVDDGTPLTWEGSFDADMAAAEARFAKESNK